MAACIVRTLTLWVLVAGIGCSPTLEGLEPGPDAGPDLGVADATVADAGDFARDELAWAPCDLVPNQGRGGAECATLQVPRDWSQPSAGSIELGVKRVVSAGPTRTLLFLVHGGPGASIVSDLTAIARSTLTERRDITVYGVDHRGLGGSHALDCPAEQAPESPGGVALTAEEWSSCIRGLAEREAEFLPYLTTSNAMRDLAYVIDRVREPGLQVVVFGGSYGTYATLRYMKLFPEQADGVVLEGIQPPGRNFDDYDLDMNAVAERLLLRCRDSNSCRARLGEDPWMAAREIVESFSRGHCPSLNSSSDGVRAFLGAQLFYAPIRDYIPILLYRMRRCEARDLVAIASFYRRLHGTPSGGSLALNDGQRDNPYLFLHVALSEMWHWQGRPDPNEVRASWQRGVMSMGLTVRLAERQDDWPTYARGPEVDETLPAWDRPLLMLQGELDAATPAVAARALATAYTGAHQTWVEFPNGAHAVFDATKDDNGQDCGREIVFQFLDDLGGEIDTSCTQRLPAIDFDGAPAINEFLFGTTDGWDG